MNTAISTEQLLADLRNIARDAEQILSASPEAMGDKAGEVRERLSKAVENAKAACQKLEERAAGTARAADQAVRSHPYESMGMALGLGLLIGVLISRRE